MKYNRHLLYVFTFMIFTFTSSLNTFASKNLHVLEDIINFSTSKQDPETAKVIMQMITEADPRVFVKDAQDVKNKQKTGPAYSLQSLGTPSYSETNKDKNPSLTFKDVKVDMKSGSTETEVKYDGKGYTFKMELKMSHRLLTDEGKKFFEYLAKNKE